jgi:hypothetical protein
MLLRNQDRQIIPYRTLLFNYKTHKHIYSNVIYYIGKYNISGKKRLASITSPAVKDSHKVHNTGAVDKYFKKLMSIIPSFYFKVKVYRGDTVISLASAIKFPLVNSLKADIGQINPVVTKLKATGTSIIISFSVGLSAVRANRT